MGSILKQPDGVSVIGMKRESAQKTCGEGGKGGGVNVVLVQLVFYERAS